LKRGLSAEASTRLNSYNELSEDINDEYIRANEKE
jgi:hypothetical protein